MPPSKAVLERLYCQEFHTTRSIGEMFSVSRTKVVRWLNANNIPLRAFGRGLQNRGVTPPTAQELRDMLIDGRDVIAKRFGVDPSAVYQWLRRHRIETPPEWNGRVNRIQWPSRKRLEWLYLSKGHTLEEIAVMLNCSKRSVSYRFTRLGIPIRSSKWAGSRHVAQDGHIVKSTYELRVCDWLTAHGIPHDYEPRLRFTKGFRGDFRVDDKYIEIWGVANSPRYEQRKEEKRTLYRLHNITLVELSSYHFNSRGAWLRILKNQLLSPPIKQGTLALEGI
jgi:AraC-like DNA-binding protein